MLNVTEEEAFINFGSVLTNRLQKKIFLNFCLWRQLFDFGCGFLG